MTLGSSGTDGARGAPPVIGIAIPASVWAAGSESFFAQLVEGLEEAALEAGAAVLAHAVHSVDEELDVLGAWARGELVDVVILKDLHQDDARLALVQERGFPFVLLGDVGQEIDEPSVLSDGARDMDLVVDLLASMGHERFGRIGGDPELAHCRVRDRAFRDACAGRGRSGVAVAGDLSRASGRRALAELLARPHQPTAIIVDNDAMALGACDEALARGLRIPEDLSILAWDDSVACQIHEVPLAVLDHDPRLFGRELGRAATALLAAPADIPRIQLPAPSVVPRASLARRAGDGAPPTPRSTDQERHEHHP